MATTLPNTALQPPTNRETNLGVGGTIKPTDPNPVFDRALEELLANDVALAAAIDGLASVFTTTVAVANTGTPDGVGHITGQVKDAAAASATGRFLLTVALSSTSYGAPADLGTLTALSGTTILKVDTTDCLVRILTKSDGTWGLEMDMASDGNLYAYAAVTGVFAIGNAAITGN